MMDLKLKWCLLLLSLVAIGMWSPISHAQSFNVTDEEVITPAGFPSSTSLSRVEKNIREAAVKVMTRGGHGSGSYVIVDGFHIILTAQHVASGSIGSLYEIATPANKTVIGRLVYADEALDVAAIIVPPMSSRTPMQFRPVTSQPEIGMTLAYSGHPSSFNMLSFRGRIVGYEDGPGGHPAIIMHSYGWFGCSGSAVYDTEGHFVGVLWGVSVERYPYGQVQEDLLFLTPANLIRKENIIKGICTSSPRPDRCESL